MKRPGLVHIELMFKRRDRTREADWSTAKKAARRVRAAKDDVPVSRFACIGQTEVGCGAAAEQVENGRHDESQTER